MVPLKLLLPLFQTQDTAFHRRLGKNAIAKNLYPILDEGWYASEGKPFSKRYRAAAELLGLKPYHHLSRIKQQFDPAHLVLKKERELARWDYRPSADKKDYVITWHPGKKFFEDQRAREERRQLAERIDQNPEERETFTSSEEERARRQLLVQDILAVTNDPKNELFYHLIARKLPDHLIHRALSETKDASRRGEIRTTRARYFTDLVKRYAAEQGINL